MAWMKSDNGQWYLTGEFTVHRIGRVLADARRISAVLGFNAEQVTHAAVREEVTRVETARAQLVKDIADAILPAIAAGTTVTAEVDADAIAARVRAALADDLDALSEDINRPRTVS